MKRILIYILTPLFLVLATACEDRLDYPGADIPEGISTVGVEVGFKDFTPSLDSRSAGDAIKTIETLWVVLYDKDGNFIRKQKITDFTPGKLENTTRPDGSASSETQTGCAKFNLTLENGWYKMYAVANFDLSGYKDTDIDTEDKLASLSFEWSEPDPNNANDDYTAAAKRNAQMFGYFSEGEVHSDSPNGADKGASELQIVKAEPIAIRNSGEKIHAWLRRAASKLTIAFDTERLQENVYIYIKSVALRDIPVECTLGKMNTPTNADSLISRGETIYFGRAQASDGTGKTEYGRWRELASGDTIYGLYSDKIVEATGTKEQRWALEHSEAAPALYFYENMQGQGAVGTVTDKRQDVKGENKQVSYPDGTDENNVAWKDGKRFGTYVEVEAYYINLGNVRPGRGPIKYRFMLGKDHITDYDAMRNHHYKLTMKFNGFANDVDFHIDYDEEQKPGFFTPDTIYVSYNYNDRSGMAVRATPQQGYKLDNITAYIINNEWRPYGANTDQYFYDAWKAQINGDIKYTGGAAKNNENYLDLTGYTSRFDSIAADPREEGVDRKFVDGTKDGRAAPNCEFGFLSLRKVETVSFDWTKSRGGNNAQAITDLINGIRDIYFNAEHPRGMRVYEGAAPLENGSDSKEISDDVDGHYSYTRTANKGFTDYVYNIPLFTRAKSMDPWATYSGANCFFEHHRYACIRFVAKFSKVDATLTGKDFPDTYYQVSYTNILQARRIENPAGIYRKAKSKGKTFQVHLTYTHLSATTEGHWFDPIVSRGPWSATIECDPGGILKLSAGNDEAKGEGKMITGRTNTEIMFTVTQNNDLAADESHGATILIKYHNNMCSHRIIVRQGYAPVRLGGANKWSTFNVYNKNELAKSPLSPGSLFRRYTSLDYPIAESNNTKYGFGVDPESNGKLDIVGGTPTCWVDIPCNDLNTLSDFGGTFSFESPALPGSGKVDYVLPRASKFRALGIGKGDPDTKENWRNYVMGVFYADGAGGTLLTADAFSYTDPTNSGADSSMGVRGVACYYLELDSDNPGKLTTNMQSDPERGNNILFSLGATGHPRRKGRHFVFNGTNAVITSAYGLMRYGGVDGKLGDREYEKYRPMAWDIGNQRGACYWVDADLLKDDNGNDYSNSGRPICIDFNTGNFMTNWLPVSEIYLRDNKPDALPIKLMLKPTNN